MQDHDYIGSKEQFNKLRKGKPAPTLTITGVWLRRIGDNVEVLIERFDKDGQLKWFKAITEHYEGAFSHIAEPAGAHHWPVDDVTG